MTPYCVMTHVHLDPQLSVLTVHTSALRPHHQEFSTWLRKVELAFRVTKTDDINKVDHLLAYMDPPAQDIAMQYAETYTRD